MEGGQIAEEKRKTTVEKLPSSGQISVHLTATGGTYKVP